ncbi:MULTISPECIES: NADH-quinone oxidoreductase subunit H [Streptomyces]|uniref:Formate hydrogenlyase subunit 4 n=1 Tax=Streptomyces nymphaeiformis TaxID=2663842 RepID=A0A7W7U3R6_9ACTN|nr:NADH-quinone oxidoreductase subunit H [Streptomyces nymphaeiformis]MBB4984487.1 formate hydrogenlyase subunit 4 [Streptomyces nymphaeiformis]
MSAYGYAATASQLVLVVAGAPLLTGLMRQVRARMEGRAGAGLLQPWRDARKLLRKEPITPVGTGPAFHIAPALVVATALVVAALVPLLSTDTPLAGRGDLIVVVALLALGTVALALAGLDTGTAFGGMGPSREMTVAALVEPTLLMAVLALSVPAGTTDLAAIVEGAVHDPARLASPASLLAASPLTAAALTLLAYAVARPLVALDPGPAVQALPVGLAVVLVGFFVLATRRRALSQVVGFLLLDNGITATAFLATSGVPLIVELGVSFDVLLAALVLQVLTARMRAAFGTTDLDDLRELHD